DARGWGSARRPASRRAPSTTSTESGEARRRSGDRNAIAADRGAAEWAPGDQRSSRSNRRRGPMPRSLAKRSAGQCVEGAGRRFPARAGRRYLRGAEGIAQRRRRRLARGPANPRVTDLLRGLRDVVVALAELLVD